MLFPHFPPPPNESAAQHYLLEYPFFRRLSNRIAAFSVKIVHPAGPMWASAPTTDLAKRRILRADRVLRPYKST